MTETADVASNLPAIILLSFWWALLSMLELLSSQRGSAAAERPDTDQPAEETRPGDDRFPALHEIDPEFSTDAFLAGACRAYEAILRAYALCDAEALRALLSAEVFQVFADASAARAASGETLELTFVGMQSAEIASVEISREAMEVTVLFRAHIIQASRSSTGEVIHGNPAALTVTSDLWTFSHPLPIDNVTWAVVATDEALEPE